MEPDSGYDVINALQDAELEEVSEAEQALSAKERELQNRIKRSVLRDIQRANDFYMAKVEPVLRTRHQMYEADRAYYRQRFKNTGAQSDFVSFDFWSMVQWAIPNIMNSFFGGDDAVVGAEQKIETLARVPPVGYNVIIPKKHTGHIVCIL